MKFLATWRIRKRKIVKCRFVSFGTYINVNESKKNSQMDRRSWGRNNEQQKLKLMAKESISLPWNGNIIHLTQKKWMKNMKLNCVEYKWYCFVGLIRIYDYIRITIRSTLIISLPSQFHHILLGIITFYTWLNNK